MPEAVRIKIPSATLRQLTYALSVRLDRTDISTVYASTVAITDSENARLTVFFNLKLGGVNDDEPNGTKWMRTERNAGFRRAYKVDGRL